MVKDNVIEQNWVVDLGFQCCSVILLCSMHIINRQLYKHFTNLFQHQVLSSNNKHTHTNADGSPYFQSSDSTVGDCKLMIPQQ